MVSIPPSPQTALDFRQAHDAGSQFGLRDSLGLEHASSVKALDVLRSHDFGIALNLYISHFGSQDFCRDEK